MTPEFNGALFGLRPKTRHRALRKRQLSAGHGAEGIVHRGPVLRCAHLVALANAPALPPDLGCAQRWVGCPYSLSSRVATENWLKMKEELWLSFGFRLKELRKVLVTPNTMGRLGKVFPDKKGRLQKPAGLVRMPPVPNP